MIYWMLQDMFMANGIGVRCSAIMVSIRCQKAASTRSWTPANAELIILNHGPTDQAVAQSGCLFDTSTSVKETAPNNFNLIHQMFWFSYLRMDSQPYTAIPHSMSSNDIENHPPSSNLGCHDWQDTLHLGPRKKVYVKYCVILSWLSLQNYCCTTDPLIQYGWHFGRTVHALCNVPALITSSLFAAHQ